MIKIFLGNVGSGKTAMAVREIALNKNKRKTFSNIKTKIAHQIDISANMIIKKEIVDHVKKKATGDLQPVYEYKLNKSFWMGIEEPINVVLDESHNIINSRRSMSKINIIVTEWMALIRRVLGETSSGYGELTLITQLPNRIDVIARDMATQVRYHVMHYAKVCLLCRCVWQEHSNMPEPIHECPQCGRSSIKKFGFTVEVWHFKNMNDFKVWEDFGNETFYNHYLVKDIERTAFGLYDTLQWSNMFSEFY